MTLENGLAALCWRLSASRHFAYNTRMADSTATKPRSSDGNHKDTIESILIAFILAFVFRAFVVEAFVIPTGSMAPTLYGAHIRLHCPDCGYTFDAGFRGTESASGDDVDIPSAATPALDYHCPNCGFSFPPEEQPVRFGDRILVLKYLYLFEKPRRWDVVVFKSPDEQGKHIPSDPEYGQNYIKRLVGFGPESVLILDGDVYTGPIDADRPTGPDGKPLFKIQRKPDYVQDALWRVIYHNDFIPHKGNGDHSWVQPWQDESKAAKAASPSGWKLSAEPSTLWPDGAPSRVFDFSNASGGGAISFNPDANPDTHGLTDYLAYDEAEHRDQVHQQWQPVYVSDLKLSCDYTRRSGQGPLRLQLSKNADVFTAEFTPGKVRLLHAERVASDAMSMVNEKPLHAADVSALAGSVPVRLELINVDYRVSVRVNGKEVLSTTDEDYSPKIDELWKKEDEGYQSGSQSQGSLARPLVRIDARQQDAKIEHLVLSRDIYYLSHRGPEFWATIHKISHLKAGEYFVMGDNSFISGDARYWNDKIDLPHESLMVDSGRVPERFMLGKAFFVYWPAGYTLPYLPINAVPDFGEMRFIH